MDMVLYYGWVETFDVSHDPTNGFFVFSTQQEDPLLVPQLNNKQ